MDFDHERKSPFGGTHEVTLPPPSDEYLAQPPEVMQVFVGTSLDTPAEEEMSGGQRRMLSNLMRLHSSLRAPDTILDKGGYSRPFPPQTRGNR